METLYKLSSNRSELLSQAEELDIDVFMDTLESIDEAIELKIENTGKMIKEIQLKGEALREHSRTQLARARVYENLAKRMTENLIERMKETGNSEVETPEIKVKLKKNPVSVNIMDERLIPVNYFVEQPKKLNKQELKEDLKSGVEIHGAELVQKENLSIK